MDLKVILAVLVYFVLGVLNYQAQSLVLRTNCNLGEQYWCSSRKAAAKCKKLDYCFGQPLQDDVERKYIGSPVDIGRPIDVSGHNPFGTYIG